MEKPKGVIVGSGKCPDCGVDVKYRANKNGHLYVYCPPLADGGCNAHLASRSDKGDEIYARRVAKWVNADYRAAYLEGQPAPEPEPEPEIDPELEPEPEEEAETEPRPRPRAAPRPQPAPRRQPVPKKSGGTFMWED